MATFPAIAAAGRSVERLLNACFAAEEPVPDKKTRAKLVRTEDLDPAKLGDVVALPALSVFAYRVDVNRTMRAAWSAVASLDGRAHLPLDVHFLLTPWADNAEHEHRILGRACSAWRRRRSSAARSSTRPRTGRSTRRCSSCWRT